MKRLQNRKIEKWNAHRDDGRHVITKLTSRHKLHGRRRLERLTADVRKRARRSKIILLTSFVHFSSFKGTLSSRPYMQRISKVPGSNLGLETDYPENFRGFPHVLPANAGLVP
jgi:hypothetical protein